MKTLAEWIIAHPTVVASFFEKNYDKESGSGRFRSICGFCLASYRFRKKPPTVCRFCMAPIRETRSISDLPEITRQRWRLGGLRGSPAKRIQNLSAGRKRGKWESPPRKKPGESTLATLNPCEDKCWVFAFNYYLDRGKTKPQADRLTWRDLQLEFPRLRKYDGCKPTVG